MIICRARFLGGVFRWPHPDPSGPLERTWRLPGSAGGLQELEGTWRLPGIMEESLGLLEGCEGLEKKRELPRRLPGPTGGL